MLSEAGKINCGVPLGSIIGTLLFLLYTNEKVLKKSHIPVRGRHWHFFQNKDITEIKNALKKEFANLCEWFVDNKHLIHFGEDKTKCILPIRKNT